MSTVSLHDAYSANDVLPAYTGAADPFTILTTNMSASIAFTSPTDMMAYALRQAIYQSGQFVPVANAFVDYAPLGLQGMLRVNGNMVEFTYLESGRGDYQVLKDGASARDIVNALNTRVAQDDNHVLGRSLVSMRMGTFRKTVNTLVVATCKTGLQPKLVPVGGMLLKAHFYGLLHEAHTSCDLDALLARSLSFQGIDAADFPRDHIERLKWLNERFELTEFSAFVRTLLSKRQKLKAREAARFEQLPDMEEPVHLTRKAFDLKQVRANIAAASTADEVFTLTQALLRDADLVSLTNMSLDEVAHELIGEDSERTEIGKLMLFAAEQWELRVA